VRGGANFNGLEAHSEELFPVWEKLAQLDVPIMVHGFNQSIYLGEKHTDDKFETTFHRGRLLRRDLVFLVPDLRRRARCVPHAQDLHLPRGRHGGVQLGRLDELNRSMAPDARNKRRLSDYMPNFGSTSTCMCRLATSRVRSRRAWTGAWLEPTSAAPTTTVT